jgi:cytochrome c biogenesis protein CcmG/thiol:disulfide interchange protein DsbE
MMKRLLPLLAFVVLAVLLAVGVQMSGRDDKTAIDSPLIGRPAPDFSLPVLGEPGRRIGNRDLLGEPFLLNVWGSWCPNCRVEHPVIAELARSGRVRVVGYNYKDEPADAQRWLAQLGDPYYVNIVDADGRAALDWGIYGAPETFLVDARGIVRWKYVGPITPQVVEEDIIPTLESAR